MKWTLTSPDGIGDFLLRLPWLRYAEEAGWRLQLVAREPTIQLARLVNLKADFVTLRLNPYGNQARNKVCPFYREMRAVRQFEPDLIFFGPSNPSFLEEQFADFLKTANFGGFRLLTNFWPSEGLENPDELRKCYSIAVEVTPDEHDFARNCKAAAFLLRRPELSHLIEPPRISQELPKLAYHESLPERYAVVCPGYRRGDFFKGWGGENWIRELKCLQAETLLPFVFVGSEEEASTNAEIFAGLDTNNVNFNFTGKTKLIEDLAALLSRSSVYIGKDTGTMHLAAALGKPAVAVFGGGTWGRFFPVGTKSVVLTARVMCRGCDWRCHLPEPACVRALPAGCLSAAFGKLPSLGAQQCFIEEFSPEPAADFSTPQVFHGGYAEKMHTDRKIRLRMRRYELLNKPWSKVSLNIHKRLLGCNKRHAAHAIYG